MKTLACLMMKEMMTLLILVGLAPAVSGQVWFDDAGDLTSWNISEKTAGEYVTVEGTFADVDANGQEFWLSSWNDARTDDGSWTDILTGSGVIIQADQEYTLNIKLASWDNGTEGDEVGTQPADAGDQVRFGMADWTGSTITLAENYLWPDNSTGDSQGYANYSVSFNTYGGSNAASIGNEIGVSISSVNWWNNFSVSEMSITAVPEPSTFALLGIGSMALLMVRWRR